MSPKSASRGPIQRAFVHCSPCPRRPKRTAGGLCQSYLPRLAEVLNSKLAHRSKLVQGSLEPVESLVPLPPPTPSLPLSLVGVFLNVILKFTLVCPWTLVRSWEHLSSSSLFPLFSLSLSFLLPFLSLLLVWVSLDAFVIAGNPSFLLVCPWKLVL